MENDNNGWIKIKGKEDLPKSGHTECFVMENGVIKRTYYMGNNHWGSLNQQFYSTTKQLKITHYQKILTPKRPI